jgi:hypothetical protein
MASPFQRYQSGIEASTGNLVPAYGQMAAQTANAFAGLGQNLAEGIKAYGQNVAKSEMANEKIKSLGQAYAEKIAMYSKDPEIAQSGILDGLMATAKTLSEAPTKGFAQRAQIVMDAEAKLNGFGQQLQESMFLRGREMERAAQEGLQKYAGVKTVTDPRFAGAGEFQLDPNKSLEQNKADALSKLNAIRRLNPKLEGSDEDFISNLLSGYEQTASKADPKAIPAAVTSSLLEQIAADKKNLQRNALVAKASREGRGLTMEEALPLWGKGEEVIKEYNLPRTAAADALKPKEEPKSPSAIDLEKLGIKKNADTNKETVKARIAELESIIAEKNRNAFMAEPKPLENTATNIFSLLQDFTMSKMADYGKIDKKTGNAVPDFGKLGKDALAASYASLAMPYITYRAIQKATGGDQTPYERQAIISDIAQKEIEQGGAFTPELELKLRKQQLAANENISTNIAKATKPTETPKVPNLAVGEVVLGGVTEEQKISVRERQKQVADFVTSRMGAIDPTDPERKRRLPVTGFDKFYQSLVPEAEIREFTTDSGTRIAYMNGKWEQLKTSDPVTMQDLRKASVGIYGQQDSSGRLIPTEFTEGSGVYIGGMFKGTDSANDKYSEEIGNLIDARRGLKKLTEINDRTGEFFSPSAQGEAEVEIMNLSAMLRTDIIGVGTVSNYEQELIKKVIRNPTDFFNLESKDRAILLALAQRVDRRIKSVSASKGLTVVIKDDIGSNKYQALREQYLREKGIL